jgi:hypothetical protein
MLEAVHPEVIRLLRLLLIEAVPCELSTQLAFAHLPQYI